MKNLEYYKDKLHKILFSNELKKSEPSGKLYTALSICIFNNYVPYIWGAGKDVDIFIQYLRTEGLECKAIIDQDISLINSIVQETPVISLEMFINDKTDNKFVFIYSLIRDINGPLEKTMFKAISDAQVRDYYIVGDNRYYVCNFLPKFAIFEEGRRKYYREHEEDISSVVSLLKDDVSRDSLLEFIRCFIECDVYRLHQISSKYSYFYDDNKKELYTHLDDEVWIDMGANYGDTIALFARNGLKCKKIYAVEGDKNIAKELKENLDYFPKHFKDNTEVLCHFINGSGFLKEYIINKKEKITLIKADIEGHELAMIKEMKDVIIRDRPVIVICLYHKPEDIVIIPNYIKNHFREYVLIIRKYMSWCGVKRETSELVLYAIPIERYSKQN